MAAQPLQVKFTVENYYEMIKHGILLENHREEIIDGLLYEMPPSTPPHAALHSKLGHLFYRRDDERFSRIFVNCPITIDEYNEPIPDYCLLKIDKKEIKGRHPKAAEISLVVEITDEIIDFDREIKVRLYAKAGIEETWLVNLNDEKIEIYSQSNGKMYNSRNDFQRGEIIQSKVLQHLKVDEILL